MAPLAIKFDNVVGNEDLVLNTGAYINAEGESFSITKLQYFISNVKLKKTDGSEYVIPQDSSYFLIDESVEASTRVTVNVPEGEYSTLIFTLGVDSLRSTMSADKRTGVLTPTADNYRDENKGYIHFKIEGQSPDYQFHIGGYGGKTSSTFNNIKTYTIDLIPGGVAKAHAGHTSSIHLMGDILKVFTGTQNISIENHPEVMFEDFSTVIANNYALMFRHDHTHN